MTTDTLFESIAEELIRDSVITKGKMFGSSGLKVSGKVFAMVVKGALGACPIFLGKMASAGVANKGVTG